VVAAADVLAKGGAVGRETASAVSFVTAAGRRESGARQNETSYEGYEPSQGPDTNRRHRLSPSQVVWRVYATPIVRFRGDYAIDSEKSERPRRKKVRPRG